MTIRTEGEEARVAVMVVVLDPAVDGSALVEIDKHQYRVFAVKRPPAVDTTPICTLYLEEIL